MKKAEKNPINKLKLLFIGLLIVSGVFLFELVNTSPKAEVPFTKFEEYVDKGLVTNLTLKDGESLVFQVKDGSIFETSNPENPNFKQDMLKEGIDVEVKRPSPLVGLLVNVAIMVGIVLLLMRFFSSKMAPQAGVKRDEKEAIKKASTEGKRLSTFKDVSGVEDAKDSLWEVVSFLKSPNRFLEAGARPPRGVLLYGPPGTGKTLLARATAGEAGVPFYSMAGSDFVEKFVGVGASRVRELFEEARKNAPCIIFIDEIDALARKRSSRSNEESNQTLNALLVEMDGFSDNSGIVIIAATNRKEALDPAVLRPGRFDKHIEVDLPDAEGRLDILKIHSRNKSLAKDVDLKRLAKQCSGFSGASLEHLMNESALMSLRHNHSRISWEDTQEAFESIILGPRKKKGNWTEQEQQVVAYHEAGHALVTHMLAKQEIERITVDPAGKAGGYVLRKSKDQMLKTEKELYHDICIAMGGRAAEAIIFGKENVTTGAQQDFRQASQTAMRMVFAYGMSGLGTLAIPDLDEDMWFKLSDDLKNDAYAEMDKIIKRAEEETTKFLTTHKDELNRLSQHLLKVRTVDGEKLDDVLNGLMETPTLKEVAFEKVSDNVVEEVTAIEMKGHEKGL